MVLKKEVHIWEEFDVTDFLFLSSPFSNGRMDTSLPLEWSAVRNLICSLLIRFILDVKCMSWAGQF